jgi:hypothetical protein
MKTNISGMKENARGKTPWEVKIGEPHCYTGF